MEKADRNVEGAFSIINQQFCAHLPELKADYDFVFIPVLHRLKTHSYWQRWGAREFYRDSDCVYYLLPLSNNPVWAAD